MHGRSGVCEKAIEMVFSRCLDIAHRSIKKDTEYHFLLVSHGSPSSNPQKLKTNF